MRIMFRRHCVKYVFSLATMCVIVSLYIAALKHNRDIHKRFHVKRLKVKRDIHSQVHYGGKYRSANMTPIKEPPHSDKDKEISKRHDDVQVYVVEEHHEVVPYWFTAARKQVIPRSGNTLVHIDGHSDLAPPLHVPGYPVFIWPHEKELKFLMQRNDAFIQASAMTGLVNRVIWVWPDWDERNHDSGYFMSTLSLGWVTTTHKDEHIQKGFCACIKNETNFECRTLTNVSKEARKSSTDDDFIIPRRLCKIKKILIVEEIHEDKALAFFGKRDWIAKSENIILDIDEDFYGCGYAIQALLKQKLSYDKINRLNNLIASNMCPSTFSHEKESDKFLMELLSVTRTKRACDKDKTLKDSEKCYDVAKIDLHRHFSRQLNRSVSSKTIRMCSQKYAYVWVQSLLKKLSTFSIKQIRALQTTGFCLQTSPKSLVIDENGNKFGLCIGSNTPRNTAVLEHIPTKQEITTRSILLKALLKKLTDHSVKLVTLSRSMRDGYTPRQFFEHIEADILTGLNVSFHRSINLHYDHELLGGKPGWPARHKA